MHHHSACVHRWSRLCLVLYNIGQTATDSGRYIYIKPQHVVRCYESYERPTTKLTKVDGIFSIPCTPYFWLASVGRMRGGNFSLVSGTSRCRNINVGLHVAFSTAVFSIQCHVVTHRWLKSSMTPSRTFCSIWFTHRGGAIWRLQGAIQTHYHSLSFHASNEGLSLHQWAFVWSMETQ